MSRKILIQLFWLLSRDNGIQKYVKGVESNMIRFTNEWHIYNEKGIYRLRNFEKNIDVSMSSDLGDVPSGEFIENFILMLNEELDFKLPLDYVNPKKPVRGVAIPFTQVHEIMSPVGTTDTVITPPTGTNITTRSKPVTAPKGAKRGGVKIVKKEKLLKLPE